MRKQFSLYLILLCFLITSCLTIYYAMGFMQQTEDEKLMPPATPWLRILLMPLDSRPPCTQFVEQLAKVANIKLIIPPADLLDNYKKPANSQALRQWLLDNVKDANMAIISTDMLIHGGLVASRLSHGTALDIDETLSVLTKIHNQNPDIKLFVFNIIPRLLIADSEQSAKFQKDMLQYSVLKDEILLFENPLDIEKLTKLEKKLPPEVRQNYLKMYQQNNELNLKLAKLTEQGVITYLVIGQDDSQPFGLPNMNKQKLQQYIANKSTLADKVMITRGTDELAVSILGRIVSQTASYQPHVFVAYSHPQAPNIIMPFMPVSVSQSVSEKIKLAGGIPVSDPQQADFILYVHIGTKDTQGSFANRHAINDLRLYLNQGYQIALIDLAEDFYASESLLPLLVSQNINITQFIAYAGWNTTSNSLGTAITQAVTFTKMQHEIGTADDKISMHIENLNFLISRFLDDYYFQKEIQPQLNKGLKAIHVDPYNLKEYHQKSEVLVQNKIADCTQQLFKQALQTTPITINTGEDKRRYIITNLTSQSRFPWDRTFEIRLDTTINFARIK